MNDVVTQLASGTSLTQTLAQQGGQILQLFPRFGSAIVAAFTSPALIAFVATIGTVVLALKHAGDDAERSRKFLRGELTKKQSADLLSATESAKTEVGQHRQQHRRASALHGDRQREAGRSDQPVADLTAQRDAMRDQISFLRDNELDAEASTLLPLLGQVNGQLQAAIDKAVEFYAALEPGNNPLGLTAAQLATINTQLTVANASSAEWGTILNISAQQIADAFASSLVSSVDGFLQALVDGKDAFGAMKDAFLDFAANFLRLIQQMILQQIALNIAKTILTAVGVPTSIPIGANHTGGIAGQNTSGTRLMSPDVFAAAARFHTGGIAGLRPDEVPIIAQRGEEVLTRDDRGTVEMVG